MLVKKKENHTAWLKEKSGQSDVLAYEKGWSAIWQLKVP